MLLDAKLRLQIHQLRDYQDSMKTETASHNMKVKHLTLSEEISNEMPMCAHCLHIVATKHTARNSHRCKKNATFSNCSTQLPTQMQNKKYLPHTEFQRKTASYLAVTA